jgi:hypothetical protein
MIEEIKLEGLDTVCQAIKNAIDNAGVDTTGAVAGQVLTATEDETTHEIEATWKTLEQGSSYVFDNTVKTHIGQYNEHSGDTVSVYPIKTIVCSPSSTIYLGNGAGEFDANIGDNAEILSCQLVAKDRYRIYNIPCLVSHTTGTLPTNIKYGATWDKTDLPSNGGSAKFFVTYIERDNL